MLHGNKDILLIYLKIAGYEIIDGDVNEL